MCSGKGETAMKESWNPYARYSASSLSFFDCSASISQDIECQAACCQLVSAYITCNQRWTEKKKRRLVNDTTSTVSAIRFHTRLLLPDFSCATMHLLPGSKQWIVFLLNIHAPEPSLMWWFKSAF